LGCEGLIYFKFTVSDELIKVGKLFTFISLLAQRNEAKKRPHKRQPEAFLGAQAALLGPENFGFALPH
jgi:hypothetical protein